MVNDRRHLWQPFQDLDQLLPAHTISPSHADQLPSHGDHRALLWSRPRHCDAPPPAELQQTFVTEDPQGSEHCVRVDLEDGCQVSGRRETLPGFRLTVCDGSTDLGGHLVVQRNGIVAVDLDRNHGDSKSITTTTEVLPPPVSHPEEEALIREARQRQRRRRQWFGVVVLVAATAVILPLVLSGGSQKPPISRSHNSGGNSSAAVKTTTANSPPPAPPSVVVLQAGRLGPTSGWASNVSDLFLTPDMGTTWRTVTLPPILEHSDLADRLQSVVGFGANDLWLATADVIGLVPFSQSVDGSDRGLAIFRSTDGGVTWAMGILPGCLQTCGGDLSLSFIDPTHGFATDGPDQSIHTRMFSTSDGGVTWRAVSIIPTVTNSASIAFTTAVDGWALTGPTFNGGGTETSPGGVLYRTTDGGVTWERPPGLPGAGRYELPNFFGPDDGVVMQWSPSPTVFATTNGGATWTAHPVPVGSPPALPSGPLPFAAPNPTTWIALTRVYLIETTDAGTHWTEVPTDVAWSKGGNQPFVFFSATDGWTAAPEPSCTYASVNDNCLPTLLATHDGGHTWSAVSP